MGAPGEGHYTLYVPPSEERNRAAGCFTLFLFLGLAFGLIVGSAYLYGNLKHKMKEGDKTESTLSPN